MAENVASMKAVSAPRARGIRLSTAMTGIAALAVFFTVATLNPALLLQRIDAALPWLALATVVMVAWRLRPPHSPIGRMAKEPGFLACGVATVLMLGVAGGSLVLGVVWRAVFGGNARSVFGSLLESLTEWSYLVGLSVIVAWVVLGAVRGWRAEPTLNDRFGRAIGWAWVVLAPAGVALRFMILLGNPLFS